MAQKSIESKAKDYFAQNKEKKEVHATSDGFLFEAKQSANAHAATLEDKEVKTLGRAVQSEKVPETLTDAEKEAAKVKADKKAAVKKVAAAKKKSEAAKKKAEATKAATKNSVGQPKNPATTGADQITEK